MEGEGACMPLEGEGACMPPEAKEARATTAIGGGPMRCRRGRELMCRQRVRKPARHRRRKRSPTGWIRGPHGTAGGGGPVRCRRGRELVHRQKRSTIGGIGGHAS